MTDTTNQSTQQVFEDKRFNYVPSLISVMPVYKEKNGKAMVAAALCVDKITCSDVYPATGGSVAVFHPPLWRFQIGDKGYQTYIDKTVTDRIGDLVLFWGSGDIEGIPQPNKSTKKYLFYREHAVGVTTVQFEAMSQEEFEQQYELYSSITSD